MSNGNSRTRIVYDLSTKAKEVFAVVESCFPHARVYVEYPYTHLLKMYYRRKGVPVDQQDRYLLSQTRLHADFVVLDYNVVIEVDGEQHFVPVQFGGISADEAQSRLEDQRYRDKIKNLICMEMEYKLVRIRYDQEINPEVLFELIRERG